MIFILRKCTLRKLLIFLVFYPSYVSFFYHFLLSIFFYSVVSLIYVTPPPITLEPVLFTVLWDSLSICSCLFWDENRVRQRRQQQDSNIPPDLFKLLMRIEKGEIPHAFYTMYIFWSWSFSVGILLYKCILFHEYILRVRQLCFGPHIIALE